MRLVGAWDAFLADELARRSTAGLRRSLRALERDGSWVVTQDGRRLLDLSSNDYLGLASHPAVREAAASAAQQQVGATASRLVVGTDSAVLALEERLAEFQSTDAALVLGSGYLANVGVIPALVGTGDAVVCDRLDHASTWDGVRLSGAKLYRYRHLDLDALEAALRRAAADGARRTLVLSESVFSMDGDIAPLAEIVELKERYGAALLIDEAHGDGVFGRNGEGVAHALGVGDRVDLHLGTFGKAFGVYGAYVAGGSDWIEYLVNASRSFVYSTGLPPGVIAAVGAALEVVRAAHDLRGALDRKAARFRDGLGALGLDTCGSQSQIIPLVVGESEAALTLSRSLEDMGILAVPIRPPTVPSGSARLRFSLTAAHADADLERALEAIGVAVAAAGPVDSGLSGKFGAA